MVYRSRQEATEALDARLERVEPGNYVAATRAVGHIVRRFDPEATSTADAFRETARKRLEPFFGDVDDPSKAVAWALADMKVQVSENGDQPEGDEVPGAWGGQPSQPLSELYGTLDGAGIDYDLRPYTARGRFALLSGRPKSGKSTWATVYAHARATGEPFIGQQLEEGTVLYVAPDENWRDVVRRFRSFGTPGERVQVWGAREYSVSSIARRVQEIGADLVVLDTLLRVAGIEDENDNAAWDAWFSEAREHVHESRAAWLALHHEKKGGGKDGEGIRGASAIFGSVDVAASLKPSEDSPHRRTLQVEGTRLDHAEPLVIELDATESRYRAVGEPQVVSILEDAALARLREVLSSEPRTVSEVHEALVEAYPDSEDGVAQSTVRNRLDRLRSAGLARRSGDGGRRDPYKYTLNRSDGASKTTDGRTQPVTEKEDTRSTPNPETRDEGRTLNRSGPLMGPERLSKGRDEDGQSENRCGREGCESAVGPTAEMCGECRRGEA